MVHGATLSSQHYRASWDGARLKIWSCGPKGRPVTQRALDRLGPPGVGRALGRLMCFSAKGSGMLGKVGLPKPSTRQVVGVHGR
jgi:hypothetical protein